MKQPKYKYLALKGGGTTGLIHTGVAKQLKYFGIFDEIEMISGSSAGAMAALLFSTGWSIEKIQATVFNMDLKKLIYDDCPLLDLPRLATAFGLHKGDSFYALFKQIVKEVTGNESATFEDWHQLRIKNPRRKMKDLCFEACNINTGYNEIFSHLTEHKTVPIVDALRASMALDGFFSPWLINRCLYSDGGGQQNCPVGVFETEPGVPNPEMLAVWLDKKEGIDYLQQDIKPKPQPISNEIACFVAQLNSLLNTQGYYLCHGPYKNKMIYCDTLGVGVLDVDLDDKMKTEMILSGESGVVQFMHTHYREFTESLYTAEKIKQFKESQFPALSNKKMNAPPLTSLDQIRAVSPLLANFEALKQQNRDKPISAAAPAPISTSEATEPSSSSGWGCVIS